MIELIVIAIVVIGYIMWRMVTAEHKEMSDMSEMDRRRYDRYTERYDDEYSSNRDR